MDHDHAHEDHNLRAAYLHVLADAMTSLLAIGALLGAKLLGLNWMDTVMGFVGAGVISVWALGLIKDTSQILLDRGASEEVLAGVRAALEADADNRVTDAHIWQVGPGSWARLVSLTTHYPRPVEHYKALLAHFGIVHLSLEINHAPGEPCVRVEPVPLTTAKAKPKAISGRLELP